MATGKVKRKGKSGWLLEKKKEGPDLSWIWPAKTGGLIGLPAFDGEGRMATLRKVRIKEHALHS